MTTIVWIHGNGATPASFNFISQYFDDNEQINIFYDSDDGFLENMRMMRRMLDEVVGDIFFVTHSLGGIYALHLADQLKEKVIGCVSISAPFGGSEAATALSIFYSAPVLRDIGPYASPITNGKRIKLNIPWTAIVSVGGNSSFMNQENDGILTIDSMKARDDVAYVYINLNHFEILMDQEVVDIIKAQIYELETA